MIIRTIGAHPLTDALQLHALIDALHNYGLDRRVYVIPKGTHHEIEVGNELEIRVGYAIINYVLRLIYEELYRENEVIPNELIEAIELSEEVAAKGSLINSGVGNLLEYLRNSILKHFSKHPVLLDIGRMRKSSRLLEDIDTDTPLSKLLGNKVVKVKRVIPILPVIGKFYYVDAKVRSWSSHYFDPLCGRFIRAGLRLALTYPIRVARDNYEVGIALLTPSSKVLASEVWRAQALLRTFRGRWVRGCDWGRTHTVFMLLDAYRVAKSLNEDAAGYLVEATYTQTQRPWRRVDDADNMKNLALVSKDEDRKFFSYIKGVSVTSESVTPVHPALKLAKVLESIGGSIDWLVDELIHKYYLIRRGELSINYSFTKHLIKAILEYDLLALYKALRSLTTFGEGLIINYYQLKCLIKALEILRGNEEVLLNQKRSSRA